MMATPRSSDEDDPLVRGFDPPVPAEVRFEFYGRATYAFIFLVGPSVPCADSTGAYVMRLRPVVLAWQRRQPNPRFFAGVSLMDPVIVGSRMRGMLAPVDPNDPDGEEVPHPFIASELHASVNPVRGSLPPVGSTVRLIQSGGAFLRWSHA